MNNIKIILLTITVNIVMSMLPIFLVILPIYQQHFLLSEKYKLFKKLEKLFASMPEVINKNKQHTQFMLQNISKKLNAQAVENDLKNNQLSIKSMKLYQGYNHDEVHVVLQGQYHHLLRFLEMLSHKPNTINIIYLSIKKNHIEIVFKADDL